MQVCCRFRQQIARYCCTPMCAAVTGSFHQILVHPDTIPLTAFATPTRLFEWLKMRMGASAMKHVIDSFVLRLVVLRWNQKTCACGHRLDQYQKNHRRGGTASMQVWCKFGKNIAQYCCTSICAAVTTGSFLVRIQTRCILSKWKNSCVWT